MPFDMRARVETWVREWWRNEHQRDFDALMRGGKLAGASLAGTIPTASLPASVLTNPMTTQDDLIVGGASGVPTRLGKGSDGQVLLVDPSTHHLVWATSAGGFTNPMTTQDDLIVGGASGAAARLAKGSSGQVLTVDASSGHLAWDTPASSGGGGGVLAAQTLTAAAASLTLAAIPQTATTLVIEFHIRTVDVATQVVLDIELNGDSNVAHYSGNNAAQRISVVASANDVANHFTDGRLNIPRYSEATLASKVCSCECRRPDSNWEWDNVIWTPTSPAAITQVRLFATGNIIASSFAIAFGG